MAEKSKQKFLLAGAAFLLFAVYTVLVRTVDVKVFLEDMTVGFFSVNTAVFDTFGGFHEWLYDFSEFLIYPMILSALCFGAFGAYQLWTRKSFWKVDADIVMLGIFYILIVVFYVFFGFFNVNCRPILIDGNREISYPSSHTFVIVAATGAIMMQANRRLGNEKTRKAVFAAGGVYIVGSVLLRFLSGAHWLSDIFGGLILGTALLLLYDAGLSLIRPKGKEIL